MTTFGVWHGTRLWLDESWPQPSSSTTELTSHTQNSQHPSSSPFVLEIHPQSRRRPRPSGPLSWHLWPWPWPASLTVWRLALWGTHAWLPRLGAPKGWIPCEILAHWSDHSFASHWMCDKNMQVMSGGSLIGWGDPFSVHEVLKAVFVGGGRFCKEVRRAHHKSVLTLRAQMTAKPIQLEVNWVKDDCSAMAKPTNCQAQWYVIEATHVCLAQNSVLFGWLVVWRLDAQTQAQNEGTCVRPILPHLGKQDLDVPVVTRKVFHTLKPHLVTVQACNQLFPRHCQSAWCGEHNSQHLRHMRFASPMLFSNSWVVFPHVQPTLCLLKLETMCLDTSLLLRTAPVCVEMSQSVGTSADRGSTCSQVSHVHVQFWL